jgi:elongation factor Ts
MAEFTAVDVKALREATGAGMMDCKNALADADGDFDGAADLVRERTGARAERRAAEREATEGVVHAYLHKPTPGLPPKVGVLVELNCETDFVAKGEDFEQLANDLALHIAAMKPIAVSEDGVDPELVAKEREHAERQAREEGKPDHIVERIVDGKVKAFLGDNVLMDQPFVKDESRTVADVVAELQRTTQERIVISRFACYEVGSGA